MTIAVMALFLLSIVLSSVLIIPYMYLESQSNYVASIYVSILAILVILDNISGLNLGIVSVIKLSLYFIIIYKIHVAIINLIPLSININNRFIMMISFIMVWLSLFLGKYYSIIKAFEALYLLVLILLLYKKKIFELRECRFSNIVYFIPVANLIIIK